MEIPRQLYVALDVSETTYHDKPGTNLTEKTSSHLTPFGYEYASELLAGPTQLIAPSLRDTFTLVRERRFGPKGLVYSANCKPFIAKVHSLGLDAIQRVFLGKDVDEYSLDADALIGLVYAKIKNVSVVLNTGAKSPNAAALLMMTERDKVLDLLNPEFNLAMRPTVVPEKFKSKTDELSTPDSKSFFSLWLRYGLNVEPTMYVDTPEDPEAVRIFGTDVGLNASKEKVEQRRRRKIPEYVTRHLDPDRPQLTDKGLGKAIYGISLVNLIKYKQGEGDIKLDKIGPEEYKYVPNTRFIIPNAGIPTSVASN